MPMHNLEEEKEDVLNHVYDHISTMSMFALGKNHIRTLKLRKMYI